MCFSAEASFAVGIPLIPAGVYCVWAAALKKPSYLGLAVVPVLFGVQQISEGFVWNGVQPSGEIEARTASLIFLFFALAFWPFWFPVLTAIMEPQPTQKWIFVILGVLATTWFWILYYPLLTDQVPWKAEVVHHSIQYQYGDLAVYTYVPKTPLRLLYFLSVALPPVLGSENWGRIPGLVLGASALLAVIFFDYAFVSVWCFFAAGMSVYCVALFYRLPTPTIAAVESVSVQSPIS